MEEQKLIQKEFLGFQKDFGARRLYEEVEGMGLGSVCASLLECELVDRTIWVEQYLKFDFGVFGLLIM